MAERLLAGLLLAVLAAALIWYLKGDLTEWRLFQRLIDTGARQHRYRRWAIKQWLAFVLPALAGLTLLGRLDTVVTMPAAFAPVAAMLPMFDREAVLPLIIGGSSGIAIGAVLTVLILWWRRRRGSTRRNPPLTVGDISKLLPRNRAELGWTALLSLSAGLTEEFTFRLFLPLLLVIVTGDALAAFAIATLAFGAMHLYQGWVGVVATTLVGALMAAAYLISRQLWVAMLLHTLIDLNGLVLRPALSGAWRRAAEPLS